MRNTIFLVISKELATEKSRKCRNAKSCVPTDAKMRARYSKYKTALECHSRGGGNPGNYLLMFIARLTPDLGLGHILTLSQGRGKI